METIEEFLSNETVRQTAEFSTILASVYPLIFAFLLAKFFLGHKEKLATLLNFEFLTDTLNFGLTLFMGVFLFTNYSAGVWFLVILRPIVVILNGVALHRLYRHYTRS